MKVYKARGIVLHTTKFGENSIIAHLLTDIGGRRNYIVQGMRANRNRASKSALFQPLFALDFVGTRPPHCEIHRFREVRSGILLKRTPFDVRRSAIALFIAEVLYRLVKESDPNPPLFERVWTSIEALDTIEDGLANFHLWFLTTLSRHLGFMPPSGYIDGRWFDIAEGCYTSYKPHHEMVMEPSQALLMSHMMVCPVDQLDKIRLNRQTRVNYLDALLRFYSYHLDAIHTVRSIDILRELF